MIQESLFDAPPGDRQEAAPAKPAEGRKAEVRAGRPASPALAPEPRPTKEKKVTRRAGHPAVKQRDICLDDLPEGPDAYTDATDSELISAYLAATRLIPIRLEIADPAVREAAGQLTDQWLAVMAGRSLLSFGGMEKDMRERARRKAQGLPLPTKASCGDPRFPDPLPSLQRACRHFADNLAHLDDQAFTAMATDDINLMRQEFYTAMDIAREAGEEEAFPDPFGDQRRLDLDPFRALVGSTGAASTAEPSR